MVNVSRTRQVTLAQTMSALTLENPRPLGTRKKGFGSADFKVGLKAFLYKT